MALFYRFSFDAVLHMLNIELKARVAFIIDGNAPGEMVAIGFLETEYVGHAVMEILDPSARGRCRQHEPPFGFFLENRGNFPRPSEKKFRFLVSKRNVHRIVLDVVKKVTGADVGLYPQTILLEIGKTRQERSVALAEVDENQTQIFFGRTTADSNLFGKRFLLRRLLDTLSRSGEFPAVKTAADGVAFDPTARERRLAMRTAKIDDVRRAAFAAIESELLAHDPDRCGD
jgi:hypothetical protein